jgi:glycosyltransferase involved in cell wall biosynthesis
MMGNSDHKKMSADQSSFLKLPVTAHLVGCQLPRRQTFTNHYLSGIWSVFNNHEFFWYAGAEQVVQVKKYIDEAPDFIFVHRLSAMIPMLRIGRRHPRIFFDLDDVVHRVRAQAALRPPMRPGKLGYLCQMPMILKAERQGAGLSQCTFVCSTEDRVRLKRLGFPRVAVVPNAIPIPPEPCLMAETPTVLFLASCDYPPNFLAAERLVKRVFPRIRAAVPDARLLIAGKATLDLPSRSESPEGVEYLGYVEDLASLYASARLVCSPITSGSGTRLKLIEAAAYGCPIVATRFAAEGLKLRDGVDIIFQENDETIAGACVELINNGALCQSLAKAARAQVQQHYDAAAVRDRIIQLIS